MTKAKELQWWRGHLHSVAEDLRRKRAEALKADQHSNVGVSGPRGLLAKMGPPLRDFIAPPPPDARTELLRDILAIVVTFEAERVEAIGEIVHAMLSIEPQSANFFGLIFGWLTSLEFEQLNFVWHAIQRASRARPKRHGARQQRRGARRKTSRDELSVDRRFLDDLEKEESEAGQPFTKQEVRRRVVEAEKARKYKLEPSSGANFKRIWAAKLRRDFESFTRIISEIWNQSKKQGK
jgi:hypothetical protein